MYQAFHFPSQLIHAVRPAIATMTGGTLVDVATLPSAVALGAPIRIRVEFEQETDGALMSVTAVRWAESFVPIYELDAHWAPHWLATLTAAIGAEIRRRRVARSIPPPDASSITMPPQGL